MSTESTPEIPAAEAPAALASNPAEDLARASREAAGLVAELREVAALGEAAAGALAQAAEDASAARPGLRENLLNGAAWALGCAVAGWAVNRLLQAVVAAPPAVGFRSRAEVEPEDAQVDPAQ
ncbi:hypothetical protein [Stigmatella erecta]|uniref:Uncharacterized protein n=1 Tax=Stigmatella erecta TaxID=83460 RepID=A0A1I0LA21_9BACT|nr:hypothetical protein [Stigmatella erecta]SEU36977.1 hypothetical protein SAMN05443639_12327 [Stigmatella erecta]